MVKPKTLYRALALFASVFGLATRFTAEEAKPAHVEAPYSCSTNYYVSKSGSDTNDGKSASTAWLTIGKAVNVLTQAGGTHGGVCVNVNDGEYDEAVHATHLGGSGDNPTGYLVFKSVHVHRAIVQVPENLASGSSNGAFRFDDCNYVVVDGFTLLGQIVPNSDESGVVVTNEQWLKPPEPAIHHVKVLNNIIRHHGGAGIGAVHADYLDVEGNIVSDTSRTSQWEVSGISTWQAVASDHRPGFHNIIRGNLIFNNGEVNDGHPTHSDGNGLIIDDFRNVQNGSTYGAYTPQTLIENNLVYGNGGSGIHLFLSDNVTVRNNTTMDNMRDFNGLGTWRGEINIVNGSNDLFFNNIAVAVQEPNQWKAPNVSLMDNSTAGPNIGNVWRNNLSFNGTPGEASIMTSGSGTLISVADGNLLGIDPLFVEPAGRDYSLQPRSPAIGKGTRKGGVPVVDLVGAKRVGSLDLGAIAYSHSK